MPSRRTQIKMTDEEIAAFLDRQTLGVLGSLDAHGAPHLVNVTYQYIDGAIVFSSFLKAQKVVNLRRNPKASFLVEVTDPYHEIQGVLMAGTAQLIDDYETVLAMMAAISENQQRKAGGPLPEMDLAQVATKRAIVSLRPERVTSWDHRRLGGVY